VKPPATSTGSRPNESGKPTEPGKTTEKPASGGGDACEACENAARSGNLAVAQSLLTKCSDPEKKKACVSRAKSAAPGIAEAAALNGNCQLASTIQQIADSMGAGSKKLKEATKNSRCK
jgi:hypothetical protein